MHENIVAKVRTKPFKTIIENKDDTISASAPGSHIPLIHTIPYLYDDNASNAGLASRRSTHV